MNTEKVIADVREIIGRFKLIFAEQMIGCNCGVLVLKNLGSEDYFHSVPIFWNKKHEEECNHKKLHQIRENCEKKVKDLFIRAMEHGHISSCQGRSEENHCRPGAIVAGGWIYGFDGLPDHMNELLMIEVALRQRELGPAEINQIMALSKNTLGM